MVQAAGVRIGWLDLPDHVRSRVEEIVGGGRVVEAVSQTGGFSPGTADRVVTEGGRRAFVKAVSAAINPVSAEMARRELRITAALPVSALIPRLIGGLDDGEWVATVLEDIEGVHPRTPWVEPEIDAAEAALRELAAVLTPAPDLDVPTAAAQITDDLSCWDRVAADPPADLDEWEASHLDELRAAAARGIAALGTGNTLTHCDIRADNMLVRPDGRMVIVDWPWACVGPDWLDRVLLAANVIIHGHHAEQLIAGVDPDVVTGIQAGLAGMFRHYGREPAPPGLPTLRAFQRWQADGLRPWLRTRLG